MTQIAFIFPGQGSQSIGMLAELATKHALIQQTFEEASDVVAYDLWQLVQTGPLSKLNETTYTQVAMLTADVAVFRLIQHLFSIKPTMMAGHSLGEYAALVCSHAIAFPQAVHVVQQRGQLMQANIPLGVGAMAAVVGLENEVVEDLCKQVSQAHDQVMPANYNAIGQVVVAGHMKAVERLIKVAEGAKARLAMMIPVSVPCHCDLLKETAEAFATVLKEAEFFQPNCPVLSNVNAQPYDSVQTIRLQLEVQLYRPVRWVDIIHAIATEGSHHIIECGPGQVLSGLIRRIDRTLTVLSVNDSASLEKIHTL